MPEVSVVVPTHNRRDLLAKTLRTIRWQRAVDLEIIVVDDGSSDGTAEFVATLEDDRIRVVRNDTPMGVAAARNRGVAEGRGAWIGFCDDDDLWAPDKLAEQLTAAKEAGREWVYAGAVKVDLDGKIIGGRPPPEPEELVARLPRWNPVPGGCSNVVASAAALEGAGGFDEALVNLADWDLWIRLGERGPPARSGDPLVGYRWHAGNASLNTRLIVAEAERVEHRYADPLDWGAIHYYLAHLCLRSGRRLGALGYFARAAMRGEARPVAADLYSLIRKRRAAGSAEGESGPEATPTWRAGAEEWVALTRP